MPTEDARALAAEYENGVPVGKTEYEWVDAIRTLARAVLELSDCDECHPLDAMRRERDVYIRMCDETRVERDALREQLADASGDKETALGNWRLALDQRDALREALALRCRQTGCDARCSCCEEKFAALDGEVQPPRQVGIADVVAVQKLGEKLGGEGCNP